MTRFPLIDLNSNTLSWNGMLLQTAAKPAEIMAALIAKYPGYASREHLVSKVWGAGEVHLADAEASLSVHISRLRKTLNRFGFSVDVVTGRGWRISRIEDLASKRVAHSGLTGRPPLAATP